jgi:8-oxo-dGTP diphosphatase
MFTIRAYGLLVHEGKVLVSDEWIRGERITKFPGGGLEYGEGLKECVVREVREEIGVEALDVEHFYTTDFFQQSAFHATPMQVISVYFTFTVADPNGIPVVEAPFGGLYDRRGQELFRWVPLDAKAEEVLTLPVDRVVWELLRGGAGLIRAR